VSTSAGSPPAEADLARDLRGYGLIAAPLERCLHALAGAEIGTRSVLRLKEDASPEAAAAYLSHLTWPATRLALFAVDGWTAVLTNRRHGSDFEDHQDHFGRLCQARAIRVVDHPARFAVAAGRRVRQAYEARMFVLHDEAGANLRSVFCVDDGGHWDFGAYGGERLPVEAGFEYEARRIRDRFTHENLLALQASIGVGTPVREAFAKAERVALVAEELRDAIWDAQVEAKRLVAEARRWQSG